MVNLEYASEYLKSILTLGESRTIHPIIPLNFNIHICILICEYKR